MGSVGVVPLLVSSGPTCSGGELPSLVPSDAEVDEAFQVDRGATVGESDLVAGDAPVADFAAVTSDQPGDGAFDHGPVLSVGLYELVGEGVGSSVGEEFVVLMDGQHFAVDRPGAALSQWAAVTASVGFPSNRGGLLIDCCRL